MKGQVFGTWKALRTSGASTSREGAGRERWLIECIHCQGRTLREVRYFTKEGSMCVLPGCQERRYAEKRMRNAQAQDRYRERMAR